MRKVMVMLFVTVVGLMLFCSSGTAKTLNDVLENGKIVIGVKGDYPPWGVINAKNEFEGWEIDLCHKLAEYLFDDPEAVEFMAVTGGNRIPFLNSGKIDIIWATMGYTPQRAKVVDYSIPYFKSGVQLLAKKGSGIESIQDLDGKKVITIKGTTGSQGLAKLVPGADQIKFDKTSEAMQALRDDRGVAFAQDDILLFKLIQDYPGLEVVGEVFNPTDWGVGFRKGEDDIKAFVNMALRNLYNSGYLKESLKEWWGGQELTQYLKRIDDMFEE